jgi:nucleotide-binding universal stress UspA family protein
MGVDSGEVIRGSVVVGVDGSAHADDAVRWAARQSRARHRSLTILHSWGASGLHTPGLHTPALHTPGRLGPYGVDSGGQREQALERGRSLLRSAADLARRCEPDLDIRELLDSGDPRNDLLHASRVAETIVIGSRGNGPVRSLLLGSTSAAVCRNACCPVVVTRPGDRGRAHRGIVVGADGTPESLFVIEFAFRQASLTQQPLTAMHAFWDVAGSVRHGRHVTREEHGLDDVRLVLAESVAGMSERYPDVEVRLELSRGLVDECLSEAGASADLVVVGRHVRGPLARLFTSSVSATVLEQASCPVAVVPEGARGSGSRPGGRATV